MPRLPILLLALLAPVPAGAQPVATKPAAVALKPAASPMGSWALKVDGAVIFRFDIEPDGESWKGSWIRPKSFASTGDSFSRFSDERISIASGEGKAIGEWAELTFPDDRPRAIADVFRFHRIGAERVEMIYADTGLAPFTLVKVPAETQLGPFVPGKVYKRLSIEMLGLPGDATPAIEQAPKAASAPPEGPEAAALPPRETDKPAVEGGR